MSRNYILMYVSFLIAFKNIYSITIVKKNFYALAKFTCTHTYPLQKQILIYRYELCISLQIPYEVIDFTEQRCLEFLNAYKTEGINDILWFTTKFEDGWNKFMVWYYKILEESATICLSNSFQINVNIFITGLLKNYN